MIYAEGREGSLGLAKILAIRRKSNKTFHTKCNRNILKTEPLPVFDRVPPIPENSKAFQRLPIRFIFHQGKLILLEIQWRCLRSPNPQISYKKREIPAPPAIFRHPLGTQTPYRQAKLLNFAKIWRG